MPNNCNNSFTITDITSTKRTSSSGFGSKTESCSQYMKNFLRQSKGFSPAHVAHIQTTWMREYSNRNRNPYSLEELLQCEHFDLAIVESPIINSESKLPVNFQPLIFGCNGFWNVTILNDKLNRNYDFTINVFAGNGFSFHPEVIKREITSKYGSMIYETWRSMILDDLPSLNRLVECIRERITFVAPSITCSKSSARLCQRVGIPVLNDVAFIFPSNYT